MKRVLYLLVLTVCVLAANAKAAPPKNPAPVIEHNFVKDRTKVSTPKIELGDGVGTFHFYVDYSFDGKEEKQQPEKVFITVLRLTKNLEWGQEPTLFIRSGDWKESYKGIGIKSYASNGYWVETGLFYVPTSDFLKINEGGALYFQIGTSTHALTDGYFAPITGLSAHINAISKKEDKS